MILSDSNHVGVSPSGLGWRVTGRSFSPTQRERAAYQWGFLHEAALFFRDAKVHAGNHDARAFRDRAALWGTRNLNRYGYQVDVAGMEKLEPDKQYIFAPTHVSEMDFSLYHFLLQSHEPGFVMKCELGAMLYIGSTLRAFPFHYFLDRSDPVQAYGELDRAVERLTCGEEKSIVIFPHGEFPAPPLENPHDDGDIFSPLAKQGGRLKRGVAYLSVMSGVPVVPVVANGFNRAFRYAPRWQRYLIPNARKNCRMSVLIGDPIDPKDLRASHAEKERFLLHEIERYYRQNYRALVSTRIRNNRSGHW